MATQRQQAAVQKDDAKGKAAASEKVPDLHAAALRGSVEHVTALLDQRADVNLTHDTYGSPIHAAVASASRNNHGCAIAVLSLLLSRRACADARDGKQMQPLHGAVLAGHRQVASLLLDAAAPLDVPNNDGLLPIHLASYSGKPEAMALLLERKALVDSRISRGKMAGYQAIHTACVPGHVAAVTTLLSNRAQVDAKNDDDLQPIHIAARQNHCSVLAALLDHGASESAENRSGQSPADLFQQATDASNQDGLMLLKDVEDATRWRNEGLELKERSNDMAAVELFARARAAYQKWDLHRSAAQISAVASECELAMERFEECAQLCRTALAVQPPLSCQAELKGRMREALLGIQNRASGAVRVPVAGEISPATSDQQAVQEHHIMDRRDVSDVANGANLSSNAALVATPIRASREDETVPVAYEACLLHPIAEGVEGAECERIRELEQRCEELQKDRDRMAEIALNHQRLAEDLGRQLQEIKALHSSMGSVLSGC